jgi:hypothetical protein
MKFMTSIDNDEMKCFHMVVQNTHKLIMMNHINFENHMFKKWRACKKKNVMNEKLKDEKNAIIVESNLCLLLEVVHVFKVLEFTTT